MADIIDLDPYLIGTPANGVNLYQVPNASMQVLEDVVNATWNLALDKSTAVSNKVTAITADNGLLDPDLFPTTAAGASVTAPSITAPTITIADASVEDVFDTFTTEYLEIATWLTGQFTGFIGTYCPDNTALYTAAEDALQAALASGTYIPAATSAQILTDDRDRVTADAARAQADSLEGFAIRGYPLPPGVAAAAGIQIQRKAQDEIAESSRKIMVMSVEQYRYTVSEALKARGLMLGIANDYVKSIASAPDMISRMTNIGYDAQSKMVSAAASFYNADAQAKEVVAKVAQFNSSMTFDANKTNAAAELEMIKENVKVMLAELATIAQQATAALNNLQVHVSMAAGGDTITTQAENL